MNFIQTIKYNLYQLHKVYTLIALFKYKLLTATEIQQVKLGM